MEYSPEQVDAAIDAIKAQCLTRSQAWATDVQSAMRSGASWNDRDGPSLTGLNARQSLECEAGVVDGGDIQIIARSTRMSTSPWGGFPGAPIGAFLELGTRYMGARPIIAPTLNTMAPQLQSQLQADLKG